MRSNSSGTSLRLYLPVSSEEAVDIHEDAEVDAEFAKGTVLVVEDEEDVRESAVATFEAIGWKVLTAGGAEAAVKVLQGTAHIDVLFADIMMRGGLNGFWLVEKTRELRPGIKILLTSGSLLQEAEALEGILFLPKPYRSEDLVRKLRTLDSFG